MNSPGLHSSSVPLSVKSLTTIHCVDQPQEPLKYPAGPETTALSGQVCVPSALLCTLHLDESKLNKFMINSCCPPVQTWPNSSPWTEVLALPLQVESHELDPLFVYPFKVSLVHMYESQRSCFPVNVLLSVLSLLTFNFYFFYYYFFLRNT